MRLPTHRIVFLSRQMGGLPRGYQRHPRDGNGQQTRCRLNMQKPGLNIYSMQPYPENARFRRVAFAAVWGWIGGRRDRMATCLRIRIGRWRGSE
jgi:hypothetical protein